MQKIKFGWKLGVTYLLLIVTTLTVFSFLVVSYFYENLLNEQKSLGFTYANILASKSSPAFWRKDIPYLKYLTRSYSEEIGHRIIIINNTKNVIADSSEEYLGTVFDTKETDSALLGKATSTVHSSQGFGEVMYLSVPVLNSSNIVGAVFIAIDVNSVKEKVSVIKQQLIWISTLSGLIIFFLSLIIAKYLLKPVRSLLMGVKEVSKGEYGFQIPVNSKDELGDLAKAFNEMSNRLAWQDSLRKQFIADAAHELRSPLASLSVTVLNLDKKLEANPQVKEMLTDMETELSRLKHLVNDLLILSSVENTASALNLEVVNVGEILDAVRQEILPLAQEKFISIEILENTTTYWKLDGGKIYRVIYNLVDNAIKYSNPNSKVKLSYQQLPDSLLLKIYDEGQGIAPEDHKGVFERFYRSDKARSRKTGGSGLGLAIVKEIISLHNGTIQLESNLNEGTTFTIQLPREI